MDRIVPTSEHDPRNYTKETRTIESADPARKKLNAGAVGPEKTKDRSLGPVKMQFFQFSSSNGQIVEVLAGIIFGSLPGVIAIALLRTSGMKAAWMAGLLLCLSALVYMSSVWHAGSRFTQKIDGILNAVS